MLPSNERLGCSIIAYPVICDHERSILLDITSTARVSSAVVTERDILQWEEVSTRLTKQGVSTKTLPAIYALTCTNTIDCLTKLGPQQLPRPARTTDHIASDRDRSRLQAAHVT